MSELKTFVCPNCGANTTNAQNCEYCGSLLVRFVEKGIDLSHTNYTNNLEVFPGLIEELKRNLKLQEEDPSVAVATDLCKEVEIGGCEAICIMSGLSWQDGTKSPEFKQGTRKQLCIAVSFSPYTFVASPSEKEYNDKQNAQLAKFQQLDSFPLFTAHDCTLIDTRGRSRYGREYAINFGEDAEGAARLVSEILTKVNGWSPTDTYDMYTAVGDDIDDARNAWDAAHGYGNVSNSVSSSSTFDSKTAKTIYNSIVYKILIWVVAIILWFLFILYRLSN